MRNYSVIESRALEEMLFYGDVSRLNVLGYSETGYWISANVNGEEMIFSIGRGALNELREIYNVSVDYDLM